MSDPLDLVHPLIARWFRERVGVPTPVQAEAWPAISRGDHVLVTAPTGSGKTLTAFLWALDRLVTGAWPSGRTRVLYVSPLKALNTDIRRNLLLPLSGLDEVFAAAGQSLPEIRVDTRSGDTPPTARRQMLRRPPEILITTPESLNLLLSTRPGREILTSLRTVILDEIHTVVDDKRGVHLITAVDRCVPLSGDFQRIALSATVKPLDVVAEYVGGLRLEPGPRGPRYIPRPVTIVRAGEGKSYDLRVTAPRPEPGARVDPDDPFWPALVPEFRRIIGRNRSSLFFTRSRRMAEHVTLRINAGEERPLAYAHHGSLAKELRLEVENKLKAGDLKAIVATSSLELGIDIGALDEVVLVQSPPSISSGVQRVGRAGHQVGAVSRGTFVPTHDQDFVESAVIARGVRDGDIEEVRPVENALDVLAQVLVSMAGTETVRTDDLYDLIRTSWPYRNLPRSAFDLVLTMLAGRYAHTRVRELRPRLSLDAVDGTAAARKGALLDLFISGGTIPDRGYYHLRHEESGSLIGELDEEFVWEAHLGQTFPFGTQHWTIRRITHNEVFVAPARSAGEKAPFWKGETSHRDPHLSDRIARFLEEADRRLDEPGWTAEIRARFDLDGPAADRIVDYLRRQKQETGRPLPHVGHVLLEHVRSGPDGYPGTQAIVHTIWGGRVNRPFALALDAAWEERFGYRLEVFAGDDAIVLQLPHAAPLDELFLLVGEASLETLLRKRLESSGYFLARFRENAGRALLLTRRRLNERMPFWMSRLRAQKLLQAVMRMPDFPILLETWRTCLRDEFDLDALRRKLAELHAGLIRVSECETPRPSPMARSMTWTQVNQYMYSVYELPSNRRSALKSDLLRELVFTPGLRPAVSPGTIRAFEEKRHRLFPGYAPAPGRDLLDWVKERVTLAAPEWERLLEAVRRDHPDEASADTVGREVTGKVVRIRPSGAAADYVCALERVREVVAAFGWDGAAIMTISGESVDIESAAPKPRNGNGNGDGASADSDAELTDLLGEWLQAFGPRTPEEIAGMLSIDPGRLTLGLEDLRDADALIEGALVKGFEGGQVCDAENFEVLLRMERAAAAPRVEARPAAELPLFLARCQGLTAPPAASGAREETPEERTFRAVERLAGLPLPAALWESEILPARVPGYSGAMLDFALRQSDLRWQGDAAGKVRFLFEQDFELMPAAREGTEGAGAEGAEAEEAGGAEDAGRRGGPARPNGPGEAPFAGSIALGELFGDPSARYDFGTLLRKAANDLSRLEASIWREVWAGRVTNDTFSALRRGLQTDFRVADVIDRQRRSLEYAPRRGSLRLSAWRESQAYPGSWLLLPAPREDEEGRDLVEEEERRKDRVRVLLERYGILFREILLREPPLFRWADVFRTLRIMELSGEVAAGYFFEGIPGPQFMSPAAFRVFREGLPKDAVWWVSAVDPASACGLAVEGLRGVLPKRVEGTHLVFRGAELVLVSQRKGRALTIQAPPDDPRLWEYFDVLRHLLTRDFDPERRVVIETINGEPAPDSPYLAALKRSFEAVADRTQVSLFRTLER